MKIHNSAVACLLSLGLGLAAAAAEPPADLILLHGRIHTEDLKRTIVQAVALRGNTIVAVGTDQQVSALQGPKTRTIDLAGRTVLPGIIDAHVHPAEGARDSGKCSLEDKTLTPAEIRTTVAACLGEHPGDTGSWFEVVQVNPTGLTLRRQDLDSMLRVRPMILSGSDGHTVWVNSAALKAAHIGAATGTRSAAESSVIPAASPPAHCGIPRPTESGP